MNRRIRSGLAALCIFGMIGESAITVNAAERIRQPATEIQTEKTAAEERKAATDNAEELLTAGVGDLFSSELTEDQYKEIAKEAEGARWGYTELGICNVEENNLNVRQDPDESGKLVGKLPREAACEIVREEGDWTYIKSGKVEGYVKSEYLLSGYQAEKKAKETAKTVAVSSTDALNIREKPDTAAEVVTQVAKGEELEISEIMDNGWIKVFLDDEEVYVSGDYVNVKSDLATAVTMTELLYGQGVSDVRVDLCQYARQFLGNPYVWGGTSLTKGADCSGFVMSIFKKYGVNLAHSSSAQANSGKKIAADELLPGDLIFYAKGGRINHVAIYIGGGQVIHASSPKTGIKISSYNYRTPDKMVRVLQA